MRLGRAELPLGQDLDGNGPGIGRAAGRLEVQPVQDPTGHQPEGRRLRFERLLRLRGGAGRGLFGDRRSRVHRLSPHEKKGRPFGLRFAAICLLPEDQTGANLELLPRREGEYRPEQVLHHGRRGRLGRPSAMEHGSRYPTAAQSLERRGIHPLASDKEDVVLCQVLPAEL